MLHTLVTTIFAKHCSSTDMAGSARWSNLPMVFIICPLLDWREWEKRQAGYFSSELCCRLLPQEDIFLWRDMQHNTILYNCKKSCQKASHLTSQGLVFLIRGAIWSICTIKSMICWMKRDFHSNIELRWRILTNQTGGWAIRRCLLSPF